MKMAVYVMPCPKYCGHCRMLCKDEDENQHFCYIQDSLTKRIEDVSNKPDWCPLHPLPEKKQNPVRFYEDGWNACLDAITGEVEV